MPKLTVLDLVQDILSEMDSDNVNSVNDTEEAYQIARILKSSYFEIISAKRHKHYDRVKALDAVSDSNRPNYLLLPDDAINMYWVKYNDIEITYKEPYKFLEDQAAITTNVTSVTDFNGVVFNTVNNKDPKYWTTFDDQYIIFDAYDSGDESTLQSSNSQAKLYIEPAFTINDTFEPDMPIQMFPQLLAEAKSTAFAHIKQLPSQKAEQRATRQRRRLSTQSRVNNGIKYADFGR